MQPMKGKMAWLTYPRRQQGTGPEPSVTCPVLVNTVIRQAL